MPTNDREHQDDAGGSVERLVNTGSVAASRKLPPNMTKPQWELLCEVVSGKRRSCHENYKPCIALHGAKLIHVFQGNYGQVDLRPTDAGIALVQQYQGA